MISSDAQAVKSKRCGNGMKHDVYQKCSGEWKVKNSTGNFNNRGVTLSN